MNIQKLKRTAFKSPHVLYVMQSDDLGGVYYIGAHSCLGTSYNCSKVKCHYTGSSSVISDLVELQPDAKWVMTPLAYAENREELKQIEEIQLSIHIGNPKCLNIKPSGQLMPRHTPEGKDRMREATRTYSQLMITPKGHKVQVSYKHLKSALVAGYSFARINMKIKHYELGVYSHVGAPPLQSILPELLDQGWELGEDRRLKRIKAAEFWELVGYEKVVTTVVTMRKL